MLSIVGQGAAQMIKFPKILQITLLHKHVDGW